jgi:hypothetical protein
MQRTAQRENAFHATMRPNSSSDNSTLRGDTRCDDDTMPPPPRVAARGAASGASAVRLRGIGVFTKTLKIY